MTQAPCRNMESLPKQFVSAMRTLFDIMDDKRTGYVKLTDIENRWRDDRTKGLPKGVIESLQKVASHDGLLTFERFCTGLKICLLCNQVEKSTDKVNRVNDDVEPVGGNVQMSANNQGHHRPPSAPLLDLDVQHQEKNWNVNKNTETTSQQRTISMPQLLGRKDVPFQEMRHHGSVAAINKHDRVFAPPKPPRLEKIPTDRKEPSRQSFKPDEAPQFESEDIGDIKIDFEEVARLGEEASRGLGDGRPSNDTQAQPGMRRTRRREPRRHTLHNGVDYNLLKRMKQIEQEKDVLLQGLSAVEEAREWYLKQLGDVQEKMRHAGRMGAYVEPWSEAHQERLELLRARVLELNRQLGALAAGWHGQLSLHMNLALPAAPTANVLRSQNRMLAEEPWSEAHQERLEMLRARVLELNRQLGAVAGGWHGQLSLHMNLALPAAPTANVLRSQNRMLAEEVNRKNERISVLEREKSALIREVLGPRNRTKIIDNFS